MIDYLSSNGGITVTSANFLANIAKEEIKKLSSILEKTSFVKEEITLTSGQTKVLRMPSEINIQMIEDVAKLHTFIAYVREAIKFQQTQINAIYDSDIYDYAKIVGITLPERPQEPRKADDKFEYSSFKDLKNETYAAVYGKYIHSDGAINRAREQALNAKQSPCKTEGQGRDLVVYTYTPILDDTIFFEAQNKYREYEKQLNYSKSKQHKDNDNEYLANLCKYNSDLEEYKVAINKITSQYNNWKTTSVKQISELKVAIPTELQETYNKLNSILAQKD